MIKSKTIKSIKTAKISRKASKIEVGRYVEAVGRRKTAVARVRLYPDDFKSREISINGRTLSQYFPLSRHQKTVFAPFQAVSIQYRTIVKLEGGGLNAQAEAVRLGIARALVTIKPSFRALLKPLGYLKRDSRKVERKHPGLRKARRAQQWRKR